MAFSFHRDYQPAWELIRVYFYIILYSINYIKVFLTHHFRVLSSNDIYQPIPFSRFHSDFVSPAEVEISPQHGFFNSEDSVTLCYKAETAKFAKWNQKILKRPDPDLRRQWIQRDCSNSDSECLKSLMTGNFTFWNFQIINFLILNYN